MHPRFGVLSGVLVFGPAVDTNQLLSAICLRCFQFRTYNLRNTSQSNWSFFFRFEVRTAINSEDLWGADFLVAYTCVLLGIFLRIVKCRQGAWLRVFLQIEKCQQKSSKDGNGLEIVTSFLVY